MNSVISLTRNNHPNPVKFNGSPIAESGLNPAGWKYIVYKTADSVNSCAYVLHIDHSQTIIMVSELNDVIQFESRDALISYITNELNDNDDILTSLLEKLGVDNAEYLE